MDVRYIWIYCIMLELIKLHNVGASIRRCHDSENLQIRQAEVGEAVTFDLCVTSSKPPEKKAYFQYAGACRENQTCFENKLRWTQQRIGSSDEYRVTIEIFSVQPSDFRTYHFILMGPSFRTDRSDMLKWIFELRKSDVFSTKFPTVQTELTSESEPDVMSTAHSKETWAGSTPTEHYNERSSAMSNVTARILASILPSLTPQATSSSSSSSSLLPSPSLNETKTSSSTKPPALSSPLPAATATTPSTLPLSRAKGKDSPFPRQPQQTPTPTEAIVTGTATKTAPLKKTTTTTTRAVTSGTRLQWKCLSENHAKCPMGWNLMGNSTCVYSAPSSASWSRAASTCQDLDSRLLRLSELETRDFQPCVTDIPGSQSIWIEDSGTPNSQSCLSYQIFSKEEKISCNTTLAFFCSLNATSYVRPRIVFFGLDLYTDVSDADSKENGSLTLYEQLNLITDRRERVLLGANVTHVRVTCQAQGLPHPEVVINSTLIGGQESSWTAAGENISFLYRRPDSLFGALGSVKCNVKNFYGDGVASQTVDIGMTLKPRIVSFSGPMQQLQKGDALHLKCATIGFPRPKMRIVRENTDFLVSSSTSGTNFLDYIAPSIDCQHSGWYRCEAEDTDSANIKSLRTHVEVTKCPPACPKEFHLVHEPNKARIQLSWIPSFNGGAQQSFYLFVNTNNSKWRRLTSPMSGDVTNVWRNISEFSAGTNYSFRIVPTNVYLSGEPDSSTCSTTVHFGTKDKHFGGKNWLHGDGTIRKAKIDHIIISVCVIVAVLVGVSLVAIFWSKTRKGRLRRLRTALESLSRLISISESNVEESMSKSSSSSSVFETNT